MTMTSSSHSILSSIVFIEFICIYINSLVYIISLYLTYPLLLFANRLKFHRSFPKATPWNRKIFHSCIYSTIVKRFCYKRRNYYIDEKDECTMYRRVYNWYLRNYFSFDEKTCQQLRIYFGHIRLIHTTED